MKRPATENLESTDTRAYNFFYNQVASDTISAPGVTSRTTNYNPPLVSGRFVAQLTNALGQNTEIDTDLRFGLPKSKTDPDNNTTTTDYDAFGRVSRTTAIDGTDTDVSYERCDVVGCPEVVNAVAAIKVTTTVTNASTQVAPTQVRFLDVLGREVLTRVQALNPSNGSRAQRTEYDNRNRVKYVSKAYFTIQATPTCSAAGPN